MRRAKERFYIFNFKEGDKGEDSEAFIRAALNHEQILKWAYVLHDKEYYNEHDMNCRLLGASYNWASGFQGMENYPSKQAYLDDQMKQPPYLGDKKEDRWYIFIIADWSVYDEDIADWFEHPMHYLRELTYPSSIKDALESLTNEDRFSVSAERYVYPADEVRSNFDYREYMNGIKVDRLKERRQNMWRPAPLRVRKRPEKNK